MWVAGCAEGSEELGADLNSYNMSNAPCAFALIPLCFVIERILDQEVQKMNSILRNRGDFDTVCDIFAAPIVEDQFATTPIITVLPALAYEQPDEEELYTSFEQAISDRVLAISKQLSRISGPLVNSQVVRSVKQQNDRLNPTFLSLAWKQCILYMSLAMMFLLVGFDLMGMLMLYRH